MKKFLKNQEGKEIHELKEGENYFWTQTFVYKFISSINLYYVF